MASDINSVDLITKREIEARIAGPLIKAFIKEFGDEKVLSVAERVIKGLAVEAGRQLANYAGGNTLEHLAKATEVMTKGGALEQETVEQTKTKLVINTTRCRYAEMYQELDIPELGFLLSCGRDFALIEGFNPEIKFTRTKTLMEGHDFCDFCFELEQK